MRIKGAVTAEATRRLDRRRRWRPLPLAAVLLAIVLVRLIHVDQLIVENYVGRQVPTAMVARNLERGSGFLRPQLDTAPPPNYFLVEPPVYQGAVCCLRWSAGFSLDSCGRIVSALATAIGAFGLHGLVARRDGDRTALAATIAFGLFPVTVRYGRSFQPDAFSLGAVLLGVDCWDRAGRGGSKYWRAAGWIILAMGLAAKVTAAFALLPLLLVVLRRSRSVVRLLASSTLVPAVLWYAWAAWLIASDEGSAASVESRSIWLGVLGVSALGSATTLGYIGRFLLVRAFTPLGLPLACWGLFVPSSPVESREPQGPDLWKLFGATGLIMLALLAAKLHHEYYWLALAPVVAVGLGRAWSRLWPHHTVAAFCLACVFAGLCVGFARSTYRTPDEWKDLEPAARTVREAVPPGTWLVAPEALLYEADYRGCRLEHTAAGARRAIGEWREIDPPDLDGPADLVEFYRSKGGAYFADLGAGPTDAARMDLHRIIRERYKVLVDRDSVIIAELNP